mgnify:CR=1 FL=1
MILWLNKLMVSICEKDIWQLNRTKRFSMKNNNMTRNLGEGNITKLLASLAIPAVVAQVVNLLYNIVDRVYIGHIPGIGANALTGVGLFTPILMLINAFAMLAGLIIVPVVSLFTKKPDAALIENTFACYDKTSTVTQKTALGK